MHFHKFYVKNSLRIHSMTLTSSYKLAILVIHTCIIKHCQHLNATVWPLKMSLKSSNTESYCSWNEPATGVRCRGSGRMSAPRGVCACPWQLGNKTHSAATPRSHRRRASSCKVKASEWAARSASWARGEVYDATRGRAVPSHSFKSKQHNSFW